MNSTLTIKFYARCLDGITDNFFQGTKGIRQWPIIDVHVLNDETQNLPFCRLQLVVETFRHSNW